MLDFCHDKIYTVIIKDKEVVKTKEKKKTGRPTDSPKTYRESFRFSEEDMQKMRYCIEKTGKSKTEIMRMGLENVYNEIAKK